jgi:hypothetical protein
MEQRRGGIRPGVTPQAEEVGEGRRGSTAVGGAVGRQWPKAGGRGWRGTTMPRGRFEQGRPVANWWARGHSDGGGGQTV